MSRILCILLVMLLLPVSSLAEPEIHVTKNYITFPGLDEMKGYFRCSSKWPMSTAITWMNTWHFSWTVAKQRMISAPVLQKTHFSGNAVDRIYLHQITCDHE